MMDKGKKKSNNNNTDEETNQELFTKAFKHFILFGLSNYTLKSICKNILKLKNQREINIVCNWTISFIHATYSTYLSYKALSYKNQELYYKVFQTYNSDKIVNYNIINFREKLLPWNLGYFFWDMIDMPLSGAGLSIGNILHHITGALGCSLVIIYKKCQIFAFSALFAECNSIFLAIRAISRNPLISIQDNKFGTILYFVHNIITFLNYTTFFISRIYIHSLGLKQSFFFSI